MSKTISDNMVDVLNDYECDGVMYGDCGLLDFCANRCKHTTLMKKHPLDRHVQIFNALDKSHKFKKTYISHNARGLGKVRCFWLKPAYKDKVDKVRKHRDTY